VTAAFGALANGGLYVAPRLFVSVIDRRGAVVAKTMLEEERAADENAVYVLTNMLQGVVERGTAASVRRLGYSRPAAGKTGTSDEARDAWFLGYTPNLVAGAWVGFDDNAKLGLTGAAAAGPIWTRFMTCADPFIQHAAFIPPPGVVFIDVDMSTHQRADRYTPVDFVVKEVYVRGTEPGEASHEKVREAPVQQFEAPEPVRSAPRRRRSFWEILTGG